MRRNPVELGRDALRGAGEVRRVRHGERGSASVEKLLQFLITPPWFGDVVIRQETSVACDEKSSAKVVELQRHPCSLCVERYHPFVVHAWLTRRIRRDTN